METKIAARIVELEQAEKDAELRLMAIRTVLGELRALLAPDAPMMTGDGLSDEQGEIHDARRAA